MEKLLYDIEDIKALHGVLDYAMEQYNENYEEEDGVEEKQPIYNQIKRVEAWISQIKYKKGFIE
jgi:hypothetical protein|tara:strand:+ start:500 stop:691 length:192 start_codon:yes stop_codon:yes gene_type:complete